jgi:hypothetical protein
VYGRQILYFGCHTVRETLFIGTCTGTRLGWLSLLDDERCGLENLGLEKSDTAEEKQITLKGEASNKYQNVKRTLKAEAS